MHVDIDTPRSDLLSFSAFWSNSSTNVQFKTRISDFGSGTATSSQEYVLGLNSTDQYAILTTVAKNGDETYKPLCMIGIPSDGTINTISVQAATSTLRTGPTTPNRSRKKTKERGKARFQLLKWLQKKMKRQKISGYSNRIKNKE